MNVTRIQSEQFQASFKHRLPPCSVWVAWAQASFFCHYYYAVKLYQYPGLVKASDLWMCQAFVILSGLILRQGSASSSELHVKSFIVLILSSDFTHCPGSRHIPQYHSKWNSSRKAMASLPMRAGPIMPHPNRVVCVDQSVNDIAPNQNLIVNRIQQILKHHTMIRPPSKNGTQNLAIGQKTCFLSFPKIPLYEEQQLSS